MRKNFKIWLKQTLSTPVFEDEEKARRARLLHHIIWAFFIITLSSGLLLFILQGLGVRVGMAISILPGLVAVYILLRRGHIQVSSLLLVLVLSLSTTLALYRLGGLRFPGAGFFILITLIAGLLLDVWPVLAVLGLLIGAIMGLYYAEIAGFIIYTLANEPLPAVLVTNLIILAFTTVLIYLYTTQIKQVLARAHRNEEALAERNLVLQQEIVERMQAEAALRDSQQMLHSIIDQLPQAVFWKDKELAYLGCNLKFAADAGLNLPTDIIGKNDYDLPWQAHAKRYQMDDRQVIVTGIPKLNVEEELTNSKGESIWLRTSLTSLRDGAEQVIGVLGIYENITPQKQIEKALRESEARFRAIAEAMPIPVTIARESDGTILYANDLLGTLFGTQTKELIGRKAPDNYVNPQDRVALLEALQRHGYVRDYELQLKKADGTPFWISDTIQRVTFEGEAALLAGFFDITERKAAAQKLQDYAERLEEMVAERTRELEAAQEQLIRQEKLAFLGQLAGGVGHELRNPLGVINNSVYFLQMALSKADETVKEYLDLIANRVREADKIVADLLNLSRTRQTDRRQVGVSTLVTETLLRHPPPAQITITTNLTPNLPPVLVDPQQIGQVLTNLITNAYQAMPEGGELTISAQVVSEGAGESRGRGESAISPLPSLRVEPRDEAHPSAPLPNYVAISITDTGAGIAPATIDRIFEPLFTTKAKGIGLGLAVSKNLVEVNGGAIKVESIEGQGSVFTIILPIAI